MSERNRESEREAAGDCCHLCQYLRQKEAEENELGADNESVGGAEGVGNGIANERQRREEARDEECVWRSSSRGVQHAQYAIHLSS